MKYLSLFSGIGGFELGIQKAYENLDNRGTASPSELAVHGDKPLSHNSDGNGWRTDPLCVGYSEIDKYATQIYQKQFPKHKPYGDITKIIASELPDFDLLVGGFPCQAFSIAGKRRGFDDTRGTLFFEVARILKEKRPRNFVLENVKGLLSHDNGRTFKTIIATLVELGYCVEWQVLNAKNFGVPQNRERVFIVGHLGGIPERKVFPIGESGGLSAEGERERSLESGISPAVTANYKRGVHSGGEAYVSKTVRSGGRSSPPNSKQNWDSYEFEGRIRRLTPLECERLMSYPDGWTEGVSDTQRYKTLGNGIVSNVVEEVVRRLLPLNQRRRGIYMKIILSAFNNKMRSEPMDVPDNTGLDFFMPMSMDILSLAPHGLTLETNSVLVKRGHFKATGHIWNLVKDLGMNIKNGDIKEARNYTLVDIS